MSRLLCLFCRGCPSNRELISPCTCENLGLGSTGSIHLDCSSGNLDDKKASDIFNAFLSYANVSLLTSLTLYNNSLTRIPEQIRLFPRLVRMSLSTNKFKSVERSVYFPQTVEFLEHLGLDYNQISTIEPGAFQSTVFLYRSCSLYMTPAQLKVFFYQSGKFGFRSNIQLTRNKLSRFSSNVFQSVLEQLAPYGGRIDITSSIYIFIYLPVI